MERMSEVSSSQRISLAGVVPNAVDRAKAQVGWKLVYRMGVNTSIKFLKNNLSSFSFYPSFPLISPRTKDAGAPLPDPPLPRLT